MAEAAALLSNLWNEPVKEVDVVDVAQAGNFTLSVLVGCCVGARIRTETEKDIHQKVFPGIYDLSRFVRPYYTERITPGIHWVFESRKLPVCNHDGKEMLLEWDQLFEAVVRPAAILALVESASNKPTKKTTIVKDNPKATNTLLKMVMAMAADCYGYSPEAKKSTTAQDIVDAVEKIGHRIDSDTVRKWLKEGAHFLTETGD